jgi:phosphoribosylanthranilate isomerase
LNDPHRTRIKICGLTREVDVDAACAAGADAVGFVLYAKSPRAVGPARAGELARRLPPFVVPVLLFVNASAAEVQAGIAAVPHALLQFHGDETAAECDARAASASAAPGGTARPYMRAVRMAPDTDLLDCAARFPHAMALLLDAHVESYGGAGKVFDWSLIPAAVPLPVVLSGGLNPANVTDGIYRVRPWAVDVSSGVELSKGVKNAEAMRRFCDAVRAADDMLRAPR